MVKYDQGYRRPRISTGDMRTPVTFYKPGESSGPLPTDTAAPEEVYKAFAKIDEVYRRDVEQAKANGTLSDITVIIRDPRGSYVPSNLHTFKIDAEGYRDTEYHVKGVLPNFQDRDFIDVIGGDVN